MELALRRGRKKTSHGILINPHPLLHILFLLLVYFLAIFDNKLGWQRNLNANVGMDYILFSIYIFCFVLGYGLSLWLLILRKKSDNGSSKINLWDRDCFGWHKRYILVYFFCVAFFLIKFIKVGGIPLISSDPYLRHQVGSLGGYVDYPTKLLNILAVLAYLHYTESKKKELILFAIIPIILNILFANRGFTIVILLGIWIANNTHTKNRISISTIFKILILIGLSLFVVSFIMIYRHNGVDNIYNQGNLSAFEVGLWVIHGDLTGSQKFGHFLVENLGGGALAGKYTLGAFISVVIPKYTYHGAEYLRVQFTDNVTAQSIGVPYSYFIDFNYWFALVVSALALFIGWLYKGFKNMSSTAIYGGYIIMFYNLLWAVRSGILLIDPIALYSFTALLFIYGYRTNHIITQSAIEIIRLCFLLTMLVSFIALVLRF